MSYSSNFPTPNPHGIRSNSKWGPGAIWLRIGCERCQRLSKECRPAPTVRKRKKPLSGSRTANLEAKLDWVISAFEKGGVNPGLRPDLDPLNPGQTRRDDQTQSTPTIQTPTSISSLSTVEEGRNPVLCTPSYDREILSLIQIPPGMAQKCLDQFCTRNLQYLPFVHIPPDMTSDKLRQTYPFLWRVMLDIVPSMDLLLGIMTFVSWVTYTKRPFLNVYAHVLMAVVADLGINKSEPDANSAMKSFKVAIGMKQTPPTARTLEERRAVLGCFLISSSYTISAALAMSRIDPMRWTPHMEESLSILAEAKDCPQDELLIVQVKIHLVLDKVYQLQRDGEASISLAFYLDAFRKQLDTVKSQVPPHLQQHRVILMCLYNAEIIINEISMGAPAIANLPDFHRLDSLYTSLQASKGWLDVWLELEGEEYLQLSCVIFFQFTRAIVTLYKLTVLDDPVWSKTMVRDTANILEYLNRNEAVIRKCPDYITFDESKEMNLLEKGLGIIQGMRMNWEPKLTEMWGIPANNGIDSGMVQSDAILPDIMPFGGIDESWMMEFLGQYHYKLKKLHDKYGDVVRTAPNSLVYRSSQAWKDIYGHRKSGAGSFLKDPKFYLQGPRGPNLINANDEVHSRGRRLLSHAFSEKALREQESLVQSYVDMLVERLKGTISSQETVDMSQWYNFTTFDIIGDLAFGEPFDCLRESQYHPWVKVVFVSMKVLALSRPLLVYPFLAPIVRMLLPKRLTKMREDSFALASNKVHRRLEAKVERPDFMSYILRYNDDRSMTIREMEANAALLILAGSETTASLLSGFTYYIMANPPAYRKLMDEIRTSFKSYEDIDFQRVGHLTYLNAALEESLRVYPPVPAVIPRVVPKEGALIDGQFIPENVCPYFQV
ncbi:Cytochrome P450 [Penicillium griseofulvum]|uniref:Cytochrome P450 n=1 Tax=Penicillium patulum TaxID=5078 RepID=A0A135LDH5_PENPA|nr:Cytochrome P450 [Penicillium griseofulvum]KXG47021.1 Cytochrome P450 [Penicillium griseofulvum]